MDDFYFVITASEDGDVYINRYTKAKLEQALANQDWGPNVTFLQNGGSQLNLHECGVGIFIIKGTAVVPQEQAVVTKWSV